jgi:hypothetical protein
MAPTFPLPVMPASSTGTAKAWQPTGTGSPATRRPLPILYQWDRDSSLVQGWAVTDPAALAEMSIPEGETVPEISDQLVPFLRREG